MRYYDIRFSGPGGSVAPYSSLFTDGSPNPGALHIELDLPIVAYHDVGSSPLLRIYGVDIKTITQQNAFKGKTVEISLGMSAGLPLANPNQRGPALRAQVWQSWGNWQGREQYLHLQLINGASSAADPRGITWQCKKNTPAAASLADALNHAGYPNANIRITDQFQFSEDYTGIYPNLGAFCKDVYRLSRARVKTPNYLGVQVTGDAQALSVYDNTVASGNNAGSYHNPILIRATDLIGQPTWLNYAQLQVQVVMRADIAMGSYVQLQPAQQAFTEKTYIDGQTASGVYLVQSLRHIGAFRERHADSWVTILNLLPTGATNVGS